MKPLEKIDQSQLLLLVLFTISATILLPLPRVLAKLAAESAWLSAILGSVLGFVGLGIPTLFALRLPAGSLPDALAVLLGKFFGKVVCMVLALGMFSFVPLMLRTFGEAFIVGMLPRTPMAVLLIIFLLNVYLIAYLGLEPLARSAQAFAIPIVIAFLIVIFGSIPLMDLQRLKPWFPDGLIPVIKGVTMVAPYFGEGAIVLYLIPALQNKQGVWKTVSMASVFICLTFTSLTFASVATLTAAWTASVPYPGLRLARMVSIGRFFHRFEPLFLSVWYLSVYIKTGLLIFLAARLLAYVFNQENHHLVLAILLVVAFPLAYLPGDLLEVFALQFGFARIVSVLIGFVLPGLLLPFTFKGGGNE